VAHCTRSTRSINCRHIDDCGQSTTRLVNFFEIIVVVVKFFSSIQLYFRIFHQSVLKSSSELSSSSTSSWPIVSSLPLSRTDRDVRVWFYRTYMPPRSLLNVPEAQWPSSVASSSSADLSSSSSSLTNATCMLLCQILLAPPHGALLLIDVFSFGPCFSQFCFQFVWKI
jgi:hypothetical protein